MTDREMVVELATWLGWTLCACGSDCGDFRTTDGIVVVEWSPLEDVSDASECEANVPVEKRVAYLRNLCYATDAFMENRGAGELHARDWKLRRATPRQIATAVWEACCRDDRPQVVESDVTRLRKALEIERGLSRSGEVLITELRRELEELRVELRGKS